MHWSIMSTFGGGLPSGKRLTWIAGGTNMLVLVAAASLCLMALAVAVEANILPNGGSKYGEAAAVATGGNAFSQAVTSNNKAYSQASSSGGKFAGAVASGGDAMSQAISSGGNFSGAMASSGRRQGSQATAFVAPSESPRKPRSYRADELHERELRESVQREADAIRRKLNDMESEPPRTLDECDEWARLNSVLEDLSGKTEWREGGARWDQECRELQKRTAGPLGQFRDELLAGPNHIAYVGNLLAKYLDLKEQVPRDELLARAYVDMVHNDPKLQEGVRSLENLLDFVQDAMQPNQVAPEKPSNELDALDQAIRRLVDQEGKLNEDDLRHLYELAERLDQALTNADQVYVNSGRYQYLSGTLAAGRAVLLRRMGEPEQQEAANVDEHYAEPYHNSGHHHHHHQDEAAQPNYYFEPKESNGAYAVASDSPRHQSPFRFGFGGAPFPVQQEPSVVRVGAPKDYVDAKRANSANKASQKVAEAAQKASEASSKASALGATAAATLARAAGGEPGKAQKQQSAKQQPQQPVASVNDMLQRLRQRHLSP